MLKIENTVTPSPEQWRAVIRGLRNPMNSWDKSDSYTTHIEDPETLETADYQFVLGDADAALMGKLAGAGSDHAKFRRMIPVYVDIIAPLYWWKEFDTYKIGTVANSCSTMHKIHAKEFELDDFSHEHLSGKTVRVLWDGQDYVNSFTDCLFDVIAMLNTARVEYLKTNDKKYWDQMIQLLPSSYNQRRTVMLNYEVLANIYKARRNHKLTEWHTFCEWIEKLPYFEIIIGDKKNV